MADDHGETERLLAAAARGSQSDWGELLDRHRARLRRMLALRPAARCRCTVSLRPEGTKGHPRSRGQQAIRAISKTNQRLPRTRTAGH
jgi:hypothetical protein